MSMDDLKDSSFRQQADAWVAVWQQLYDFNPNFIYGTGNGRAHAVAEIKRLQEHTKTLRLRYGLPTTKVPDETLERDTKPPVRDAFYADRANDICDLLTDIRNLLRKEQEDVSRCGHGTTGFCMSCFTMNGGKVQA